MLNSVFGSFRSKKAATVGEKRERHRENEESAVIVTDVLQTPPQKRARNKETGSAEGSSSPVEVISGWFKSAMSWADKYNAWNYVVGKKKSKEKTKTIITIDDEVDVKELKTSDVVHVRSTSEVIILDDYQRPTTSTHIKEQKAGSSKEVIVIDSPLQRKPLHQYISKREKELSVFYTGTSTPLRPPDEFDKGHKPVLNIPTLFPNSHQRRNPKEIVRHDNPKESRSSVPVYHRAPQVPAGPKQQKPTVHNEIRTLSSFNVGKHPPGAGKVRIRQHTKENTRRPPIFRRHRSTAKEVVRLEEKKRYMQLLSQFTTSCLSHHIDDSFVKNKENSILSSSHWSSDPDSSIVSSKPTISQRRLVRPPETSLLSPRSSLLPSQTSLTHGGPLSPVPQPTVLKMKPTVLKTHVPTENVEDLPLYYKQKSFSSKQRSIAATPRTQQPKPQQDALLSDEWTKKWRHILSPENLSRERENAKILREEKRQEELEAKRKEEQRAAIEEVKERIRIEEESEEEEEEEEEEDASEFVPLTDEMEREIDRALARGNPRETLVDGSSVTRGDIVTLSNLNWLNDEVINVYFSLITERSKSSGYPKVHSFNSFFYPKLIKTGYASLKRWTRKVDIFTFDLITVPIHLGMHWCLAVIDFRHKTITYYDSLKGSNGQCLEALKNYLTQESMDKKKVPYDTSSWTLSCPKGIPEQLNGCDCGVFACKYAEYICRDAKFTFDQRNMPYFRRRMVYEILKMKLC